MKLSPTGFHHVALRVRDVARAARFYSRVLGLQEVPRRGRGKGLASVWFRVGSAVLMVEPRLRGRGPASGSGHLLGFRVKDLTLWRVRLARFSVRIDDRTDATLYFRDPDGHRVGLSVYPLGSARKETRPKPKKRAGRRSSGTDGPGVGREDGKKGRSRG